MVGQRIDILELKMSNSSSKKLKRIIRILKFILTIDDKEILKSTIETIIDMLEEDVEK